MKKMTTNEFIERAKQVHGNKYDYSKVEYNGTHTKVCIICPIHGEFWQTPHSHLKGGGCNMCVNKYTIEDFISKARKVHGDKYDYSRVVISKIGKTNFIEIICKEHGIFKQRMSEHLYGHGCPYCSKRIKKKQTEFIEQARKIHGNKYDYSKIEYINNKTKVCIICPIHGEFWQIPNDHLQGVGCSKCNSSHLENEIRIFLNEKNIEFEEQKRFDWLGAQSLDFYIPSKNISIECQGIQHFEPKKYFGGEKDFKLLIERDERKKKLCNEHNVKIIYYSNLGIEYPYEVFEDKNELYKKIC